MENSERVINNDKSRTTLSLLFENYNEDYQTENIDWNEPVGREIW